MTITSLLVANRGEIARRVMRTARQMGIRCVAVYVDDDADAPFVHDADEAVRLSTSYLDGAQLIAAAQRVGADAIHPGYGFLSENAAFARDVEQAGLTWVGPPPSAIAQGGDKLAAKQLAASVGVPTLPYAHDASQAEEVGYPLLVKAAAGGGGKGMRIVSDPAELSDAVAAARREALSGFGDETVFLERYVAQSRHIEIQVLGDIHGNLVHLFERECSIQRRHQKLIEESPSPALDDALRARMGDSAIALARAMGYYSTGTMEFLFDDESREYYFLEVNTRLQVEHPVTEEVTGLDLVREQLRVAMGEPLGYTQDELHQHGHAIEARLCAEDVAGGFLPATGTLVAFEPASAPTVRWESGVTTGSVVTIRFDPMLAKVIAFATTRTDAASTLATALERIHLGGVATNRDFLAATLRHPAFLSGATTTQFIEQHQPARTLVLPTHELVFAARAGTLWLQGEHRRHATTWASLPSGWHNARLPRQQLHLRHHGEDLVIHYALDREGRFDIGDVNARVHEHTSTSIDVEIDGLRRTVRLTLAPGRLFVQAPTGTVEFELVPRFTPPGSDVAAGGLHAPMPGTVLEVRVGVGDEVDRGDVLVVLEAMKMEHRIVAPHAGVVTEVLVSPGSQVENGAALLTLEEIEQ